MGTGQAPAGAAAPPSLDALAELAARWHAADGEHNAAIAITEDTLSALDAADGVGLIRRTRKRLSNPATAGQAADQLDALQVESDKGPSRVVLDAAQPLIIPILEIEARWPVFTTRAGKLGVASMACLPLRAGGHDLGTLNLYAHTPYAFAEATGLLTALATHAALALRAVAEREQLSRAVASRDRIAQAKGILMLRHHCTAQQAFDRLVSASQAANLKLADVADWLLDQHHERISAQDNEKGWA